MYNYIFVSRCLEHLLICTRVSTLRKRKMINDVISFGQVPVALRSVNSTTARNYVWGKAESCSLARADLFYVGDLEFDTTSYERLYKWNTEATIISLNFQSWRWDKSPSQTCSWPRAQLSRRRRAPWYRRPEKSRRRVPAYSPRTSCPRPGQSYSRKSSNPTRRPPLILKPPALGPYLPAVHITWYQFYYWNEKFFKLNSHLISFID